MTSVLRMAGENFYDRTATYNAGFSGGRKHKIVITFDGIPVVVFFVIFNLKFPQRYLITAETKFGQFSHVLV